MQMATSSLRPLEDQARDDRDASFWRRPAGERMLRGLAILVGVAAAAAVVVFDGFVAVFLGCPGHASDPSALCRNFGGVIDYVEVGLVLAGALAALGGGIVTCVRKQPRFLVWGLAVAVAITGLILLLAQGQDGMLS